MRQGYKTYLTILFMIVIGGILMFGSDKIIGAIQERTPKCPEQIRSECPNLNPIPPCSLDAAGK